MDQDQQRHFEEAFSGRTGTIARDCACGRHFYCTTDSHLFDEGELERYVADHNSTAVDYSIGSIIIDGVDYANACTCWEDKASKIIAFIEEHGQEISDYLKLRKAHAIKEAEALPTV